MKFRTVVLRAALTTFALVALATPSRAAVIFTFEFDASSNDTVTPPIVGTGTLTLSTDPGNGTFAYTTLNPTLAFSFPISVDWSFTEADLVTLPRNITLNITDLGGGIREVTFTDVPMLAFKNVATVELYLHSDGNVFDAGQDANIISGNFRGLATPVPEPASLALAGMAGLVALARRRTAGAA